MSQPLTIAFSFDENYAMPASISIASILRHLPESQECHIYVADMSLRAETKKFFDSFVKNFKNKFISFIHPPKESILCFSTGEGPFKSASNACFSRLFLPQLLKEKSVLYLDSDTLTTTDITPLWKECQSIDQPLAMARDVFHIFFNVVRHHDHRVLSARFRMLERLGIPDETPYYNSGVLFMNLDQLRSEDLIEKALHLNQTEPESRALPVQSILNTIYRGRIHELDFGWNYQVQSEEFWRNCGTYENLLDTKKFSPKILHFVSKDKPWNGGCSPEMSALFYKEAKILDLPTINQQCNYSN